MHAKEQPEKAHAARRAPNPPRRTGAEVPPAVGHMSPQAAATLQRTVGNTAVARMLEERRDGTRADEQPVRRPAVQAAEAGARAYTTGNQAATASVQRAEEGVMEADAPTRASTPPADEAALLVSTDLDAVMVRLSASLEANALQKTRKFNPWEPHKKWPEDWLLENTRLKWVLERRLVLGKAFQQDELRDIEILSAKKASWLNDVGIGTLEEARQIAAGKSGTADAGRKASAKGKERAGQAEERERADYSAWLKLTPGRRILAATLAFQTQAPAPGTATPNNPAYTLGRFMRTNELKTDDPERETLENERNEQIRETAVDTLFPDGLREEQKHESAGDHATEEMQGRDAFARNILTNVLLVLRHGLQVMGKDGNFVDYKEGDVIRALAHGGRVHIRIPALRKGESPHQLLDFLGATDNGTPNQHMLKRDYATHRSSVGKNKEGEPGSFKEKGGVGAALKNKISEYVPGMTTPDLLAANVSGGGFGTKDWNGDVVLPNGSYGHLLLVFTAPTAERDGALQVGLETVAPGARSPVGYHHGVRSTEATANPESVLHGHKQDKIGTTRVELGKTGGEDWHDFLRTIQQDWVAKLEAAKDTVQKRKLYEELVGPRA
ncbi:PE-PGRS family protein [Streptomyces guryensis]|uniref:PE-PGRS family protein n=1 Tax=Streptomyces guryensis TaxID=2886947 RepID=A0A9Q3Z527_9ACTN|nr:PE-PGRS family protein [Streptomyces guryensis]MCD9875126.1 PE-PGRS family protein [Streptomyces guryensis]